MLRMLAEFYLFFGFGCAVRYVVDHPDPKLGSYFYIWAFWPHLVWLRHFAKPEAEETE